jgi:GAF domain-containing protein
VLENFAAYAALSLRRARLHDQIERAKQIAEAVAYVTALGDGGARLSTILQGAMDLLGCDGVVLYIYDQQNKKFEYPPKQKGLKHPAIILRQRDIAPNSLVHKMLKRNTPYAVNDVAKDRFFRNRVFTRREKIVSCVAIPLEVLGEKVGVMFINYCEPHRFPADEISNINLVGIQAAVAISNARVYEQAQKRGAVLQSLNRAGLDISGSLSLTKTLKRIAEQSLKIVKVTSGKKPAFSHVLVRSGFHLDYYATTYGQVVAKLKREVAKFDLSRPGVPAGIAGRAVQKGATENIGDVRSDKDYVKLNSAIRSQLSVPLQIRGRAVGVLTIEHPELDVFSLEDQKSVEQLATQAAIAIEHARQHKYFENLYQAAQKIAKGLNLRQVLETVAERARDILGADSAAILSYDSVQNRFIPEEMVAVGIPAGELSRFRAEEPKPGRTAYTVLDRGWIGVEDLSISKLRYLGDPTRSFLTRIGVRSFEGIALKVGGEPVGVLYVNYAAPRSFDASDRRVLENFAAYAALSLRRARLHDQIEGARKMAEAAVSVTTLGGDNTLDDCTVIAKANLNCDSATLYAYDPVSDKLTYPPNHIGLNDPARVEHPEGVARDSIVWKMLQRDGPYFVKNVGEDPIFRHSRFAREEGIKSCAAIPLLVRDQKVGVMFTNYRSPHLFINEEIESIRLFSLQVAVAVSNTQLYDQAQKRLEALSGLYKANQKIIGTLDTKVTLREIARQALKVTGSARKAKGYFSHVALKDDAGELDFIWSSSQKILKILRDHPKVSTGIAGRVLRTGVAKNVGDVRQNEDYVEVNVGAAPAERIRSQLSVPLQIGRRVIGVLTIEHPELDAFSQEDQSSVELLAAQAAIAIDHAQQFEALTKAQGQVGSLTALAWMGMANNAWHHNLSQYAITTQLALSNLRGDLQQVELGDAERERIEKRLNRIDSETEQMLSEPIAPPLGDKEGTEPIFVNNYVEELMGQMERSGQLTNVEWKTKLMAEDTAIICNRDWLGRAIDILVKNSVKAMRGLTDRRLTVTTRRSNGVVEISFTDTGKGIPPRIRRKLFHEVVPKPFSKGMGIGLMILQAIVQAYKGYVAIGATGVKGTTMVISFPKAEDV